MKKTILVLAGAVTLLFTVVFFPSTGCSSDKPKGDTAHTSAINSSYAFAPTDFTVLTQAAADTFSWLSFIALNWPANQGTCGPDTLQSILTGNGPVVWETYLSTDQVFVAPGSQPVAWCSGNSDAAFKHVPPKVLELGRKNGISRFIHQTAKSPGGGPDGLDQASGGPLVDQNGRFARYEVRMNYDEYNYITTNTLWSKSGQQQFVSAGNKFDFPGGPTNYGTMGAIEIKAAWKVIGANDTASKFYTIQAIVYNDDSLNPSPGPNPVTLGLVGLHIAHKTATQHNWVWSTFEHIDNLTHSFYNPSCDTCTPNTPITGSSNELNPNGTPIHAPTQVTRVNPVADPFAAGINTYFRNMLNGSVWQNYQLISAQWLFFEDMEPQFLANSVQETYLQGQAPPNYGGFPLGEDEQYYQSPLYHPFAKGISSSCMGCHYTAKSAGIRSDFSFIISDAQ